MPEGRRRGYAGNLLHEAHTAILMREHGIRRTRFAADNIRSDVGARAIRSAPGSCSRSAISADVSMIIAEDHCRHNQEFHRADADRAAVARHNGGRSPSRLRSKCRPPAPCGVLAQDAHEEH
jgi:hypothetical protein